MPSSILVIRHEAETDPPQFVVQRLRDRDSKTTPTATEIPSPKTFSVESSPNVRLLGELRWYLERFLDYPFPPETDGANASSVRSKPGATRSLAALGEAAEGSHQHFACDCPAVRQRCPLPGRWWNSPTS
jgi:hypothetical protein